MSWIDHNDIWHPNMNLVEESPPRKKWNIMHFKRHSEAYAQSICIHDLTTFVSLIYENIMAKWPFFFTNLVCFKIVAVRMSNYNDTSRE